MSFKMEDPRGVCESVDLAALERGDAAATSKFSRQMHGRGIGVVRCSDALMRLHEQCVDAAKAYFASANAEEKTRFKMGGDGLRDWGWVEMVGVKVRNRDIG